MKHKATTKIILDTRYEKENGVYPVKLRVTYNRKQKYYPCHKDLTIKDFERVMLAHLTLKEFKELHPDKKYINKDEKELRVTLDAIQAKAYNIIDDLKIFNFYSFENKFHAEGGGNGDVYSVFNATINELNENDRVGTAGSYESAMKSLQLFKPKLLFEEINPSFLEKFERWHKDKLENSATTVGIYIRALRAIYNRAIGEGLASKELYPFGKQSGNKYTVPKGTNIKKSLTLEEVGSIYYYEAIPNTWGDKAKDFWLLTYYCNGMNMIDIAKLKDSNIYDDEIHFVRNKTARTKKDSGEKVIVSILPEAKEIIKKWRNKKTTQDNYLFPILKKGMDAKQQKMAVQEFVKQVNKYVNRIAAELGINKNVTTYVARHSFATIMKRSGASIEYIQEALNHSDPQTTKDYLGSFEKEARQKNAAALIAFKKPKLKSA